MRSASVMAAIGGLLGAVVALIAHYQSRTVPKTFYVGVVRPDGSGPANAALATPLVHPSWWPTLPVAVAAGLVVGAAIWGALHLLGARLVWTDRNAHTLPRPSEPL